MATDRDATAEAREIGAKLATLASKLVNDADCSIAAKAAAAGRPCAGDACDEPTIELGFVRDAGELALGRMTIRRNLAGENHVDKALEALALDDVCAGDEGD